ncbi:MAG: hypothetical protein QXO76_04360, partial [Thermoproteota archaeon]
TIASLFAFWGKMLGTGLRVLEATNSLFVSTFSTDIIGVVAFLLLTALMGVTGAAVSYALSSLLSVLFLSMYWKAKVGNMKIKRVNL